MNDSMESEGDRYDITSEIGADDAVSVQSFAVYIPNKTLNGREFGNQRAWVLEALELLGRINGGATAMPPVEGTWLNDLGNLISENPVVVYSYIKDPDVFETNLPTVREFLHRMGRETDQGEVAVEFDGRFYRIRRFDSE